MNHIDIFLQTEGNTTLSHLNLEGSSTVANLKATLVDRNLATPASAIFIEDDDDPLDDHRSLDSIGGKSLKLHANRCTSIAVTVTYGARTVSHKFSPSTTVAKVQRWSTSELGLTPDDATEHVLQLKGTLDRPSVSTHIGSLARECEVAFDLVPNERIQG